MEPYRPIMGKWRTDKGFVISIHQSPSKGVIAFIESTPGYRGEDIRSGKMVITHIKPLVDGGYTGRFVMPGKLEPVKVRMIFNGRDTLLIGTWDRRAQGNIMEWQRLDTRGSARDIRGGYR